MANNISAFRALRVASLGVLAAKRDLEVAQAEKTAALVAINESGCPKRQVARRAVQHLLSNGFTPEQIRLLGLSAGSVRLALAPVRTLPTGTPSEQR